MKKCDTCNQEVTNNFIEFQCPDCKKTKIIRCLDCKETGKQYACKECGFTGP